MRWVRNIIGLRKMSVGGGGSGDESDELMVIYATLRLSRGLIQLKGQVYRYGEEMTMAD